MPVTELLALSVRTLTLRKIASGMLEALGETLLWKYRAANTWFSVYVRAGNANLWHVILAPVRKHATRAQRQKGSRCSYVFYTTLLRDILHCVYLYPRTRRGCFQFRPGGHTRACSAEVSHPTAIKSRKWIPPLENDLSETEYVPRFCWCNSIEQLFPGYERNGRKEQKRKENGKSQLGILVHTLNHGCIDRVSEFSIYRLFDAL